MVLTCCRALLGEAAAEQPLGPGVVVILAVHALQQRLLTAALGRVRLHNHTLI